MPGRKLTRTESKLQKQWNERNMSDGSLLYIRIEGGTRIKRTQKFNS